MKRPVLQNVLDQYMNVLNFEIPLYLDGDILHNSYIGFFTKILYLFYILIYILNHTF
jgi:hypothetical protein